MPPEFELSTVRITAALEELLLPLPFLVTVGSAGSREEEFISWFIVVLFVLELLVTLEPLDVSSLIRSLSCKFSACNFSIRKHAFFITSVLF